MKNFITKTFKQCRASAAAFNLFISKKVGAAFKRLFPFLDVGKGLLIWSVEAVAYVIIIIAMLEAVPALTSGNIETALLLLFSCLVLVLITLMMNYTHYMFDDPINQNKKNTKK